MCIRIGCGTGGCCQCCSLTNLIFSGVVLGLGIWSIVVQFQNLKAITVITDVEILVFFCAIFYFAYAFIAELMRAFRCAILPTNGFDYFMQYYFFKYTFSFQAYGAFLYIYTKLITRMNFYGSAEFEFTWMYYTLIMFVLMVIWVCLAYTHTAGELYKRDVMILLIISAVSYVAISIINSIDESSGKPFLNNVAKYLLIIALSFNGYQTFKIVTAKKGLTVG